ncbi:MAG: hypothetical protein KC431_17680 [Myxococcales bacterium]|nr:hypothetical protein [Myxococcales bacterium]
MEAKGSYATVRERIVREFGEHEWIRFENDLRKQWRDPVGFQRLIASGGRIPFADFVRLQEAWVRRFYGGDERQYWKAGAAVAGWALTRGSYRHLLFGGDQSVASLDRIMTRLWRVYTDVGELLVEGEKDRVTLEIRGVPRWHLSFEYGAMGYAEKTIELATGRIARPQRIFGEAERRLGCRYCFELGEAQHPSPRPRNDPGEDITRRASVVRDLR